MSSSLVSKIITMKLYKLYEGNVGGTLEELVNHSPAARDLRIFLVFYQHPKWFIRL